MTRHRGREATNEIQDLIDKLQNPELTSEERWRILDLLRDHFAPNIRLVDGTHASAVDKEGREYHWEYPPPLPWIEDAA